MLDDKKEDDHKWVDGVKKAMNIGLVNQTDRKIRFTSRLIMEKAQVSIKTIVFVSCFILNYQI